MGYTVIKQYGDITEVLQYEKNLPHRRKRAKRRKATMKTRRSLKRTRDNFFELVYENVINNLDPPTFLTLTYAEDISYAQSIKDLKLFYAKLKKLTPTIRYINVPEYTKKGRIHYHALAWGIPRSLVEEEKHTRLLQNCWSRGYIDALIAYNKSKKIAGYLTKYFSKASETEKMQGRRLYNASRNILKPRKVGSHFLSSILSDFIEEPLIIESTQYETLWLGTCSKRTYQRLSTGESGQNPHNKEE